MSVTKPEATHIDYRPQTKRCLKCRTPFKSKHQFNRICISCKSESDWEAGINVDLGGFGSIGEMVEVK